MTSVAVLMSDLVGYSRLHPVDQVATLHRLNRLLENLEPFTEAQAVGRAFLRDTGDGVALVFLDGAGTALASATRLARTSSDENVPTRFGLHCGLIDLEITDLHGHVKGAGEAINTASRVMDLGDAGHILMTAEFVEGLRQIDADIDECLFDFGDVTVKHGAVLRVYNYSDGFVGAAQKPRKLGGPALQSGRPRAARRMNVAIGYKRHATNDEHVMNALLKGLTNAGHKVFVDLNLEVGVKWADAIRAKIRDSDAMIVLLSERAVGSEMVEAEIVEANQYQQAQAGKPRLLPVRIAFDEPLPPPFGAILDGLQFVRWDGPHDDVKVVGEILRALDTVEIRDDSHELEPIGGAVPLDSAFYVERSTDSDFMRAIQRRDGLILLKGPRQVGKTSLLGRALQAARSQGERVVTTDCQSLNESDFANIDTFFKGLCALFVRRMGLRVPASEYWVEGLDANANLEYFLSTYAIPESGFLVWGLDEVDRLFGRPYASQVFALFRSWYNVRASDPSQPYARLVMAIAYATEAHLFISDLNQSPFNVGTRLRLDDFSPDQVSELNERYGRVLATPADLMRLYELLGGQPFLVRRALNEMVEAGITLNELMLSADREEGLYGDHLRRILMGLTKDESLLEASKQLLRRLPMTDGDAFLRMRAAGVLRGESMGEAQFRCRLYRDFLDRHLR